MPESNNETSVPSKSSFERKFEEYMHPRYYLDRETNKVTLVDNEEWKKKWEYLKSCLTGLLDAALALRVKKLMEKIEKENFQSRNYPAGITE